MQKQDIFLKIKVHFVLYYKYYSYLCNYNPQNEMFRLLGTKRSFSQNETFFFSHPYPPTLPFSA